MPRNVHRRILLASVLAGIAAGACTTTGGSVNSSRPTAEADRKAVADLDTEYQAAVGRNDAVTLARIHHPDMILVLSSGAVITGAALEQRARDRTTTYERQVEVDDSQVVRVWGDTAVVTAKLWIKGTRGKDAIDYKLWFSDTYVRTPTGWRYAFGQAGAPLKE
jgi:ketosteroid isomerase-like protein